VKGDLSCSGSGPWGDGDQGEGVHRQKGQARDECSVWQTSGRASNMGNRLLSNGNYK
jgi:hypothetical protein